MNEFFELTPELWLPQVESALGRGPLTGRLWPLNSLENRVYELELEGSDGRVVVKFHRPGARSLEELLEEQSVLNQARLDELPVLTPIHQATLLGGTYLELKGGFFASLAERVRGRLCDELTIDQWLSLGRVLARFHQSVSAMSFQHRPHFFDSLKVWDKELEPWAVGSSGKRYLQMAKNHLAALLNHAMRLPAQIIHGDLHVGNLLWIQNELTLLDFDECSYGPVAQDFWLLAPGCESWAVEARSHLLKGYRELRDCNEYSNADFEVLRALRLLKYNQWIARRYNDPVFKNQFPYFGQDRWWEEESEALSKVIESYT
jgi:Ser/Thr protein kinase RdoA (MazF antagonist)